MGLGLGNETTYDDINKNKRSKKKKNRPLIVYAAGVCWEAL